LTAKLEATGLTLFRGDRCLFTDLSFALNDGELLLLEGSNGSGKTSLMRAIAGLLTFDEGELHWDGNPVARHAQLFRSQFTWLGHRTGLKPDLTPVENLRFDTVLRARNEQTFDVVFERLGITRLAPLPVRLLSAGQQRRVALARLLLSATPLWLVDEPFTNLDREGRALVLEVVDEHLEAGGLCVMAAHQDVLVRSTVRSVRL
jgi:heme exporter protein A